MPSADTREGRPVPVVSGESEAALNTRSGLTVCYTISGWRGAIGRNGGAMQPPECGGVQGTGQPQTAAGSGRDSEATCHRKPSSKCRAV